MSANLWANWNNSYSISTGASHASHLDCPSAYSSRLYIIHKEETGVKVPIRNWLTPPGNNARFLHGKKSQPSHFNIHMLTRDFSFKHRWTDCCHFTCRSKRSAALNVVFGRFSKIPEVPLSAYEQQISWCAMIGQFCFYVRPRFSLTASRRT